MFAAIIFVEYRHAFACSASGGKLDPLQIPTNDNNKRRLYAAASIRYQFSCYLPADFYDAVLPCTLPTSVTR